MAVAKKHVDVSLGLSTGQSELIMGALNLVAAFGGTHKASSDRWRDVARGHSIMVKAPRAWGGGGRWCRGEALTTGSSTSRPLLSPCVCLSVLGVVLCVGLIAGRTADVLGRNRAIGVACLIFLVGSTIMTLAVSFPTLLLGRIVTVREKKHTRR